MAKESEPFIVFTIYFDHPDYLGQYVVLMNEIRTGVIVKYEDNVGVYDTLEEARTAIPEGFFRFDRSFDDDQTVVECWL